MTFHNELGTTDAHTAYRQVFPNAAARTGDAGSYSADDVTNRIKALQDDTKAEYVLTNNAPVTWTPLAGGGGGEANTTSNQGGGEGLALAKSGVDLPFKTITAGTNITLTPSADELEISAAGGNGGGGVALDVDGGNDLLWDSAIPDPTGLGLLRVRRNTTGAEATLLKGPDQVVDSPQEGTSVLVSGGVGSDQSAGTTANGTDGGFVVVGAGFGRGGNGSDAQGATPAGNGGQGGTHSFGGAPGGAGGAGDGVTQGGTGGPGGQGFFLGGNGGVGADATASAPGNSGGTGAQTSYFGGDGGAGGNGSAAQVPGDGGFGGVAVVRGGHGGASGGPAGGGSGTGGIGGDVQLLSGDAGIGTGGGTDGDAGDVLVDCGNPYGGGAGTLRMATSGAAAVESGGGDTPWNHNGRRVIGLGIIGSVQTVANTITDIGTFPTTSNNTSFVIDGTVVARRSDGERKAWVFSALANRGAGAGTAVVDSLDILNTPQESSALPWTLVADDNGFGTLRFRGNPNEVATIKWSIQARVHEVS